MTLKLQKPFDIFYYFCNASMKRLFLAFVMLPLFLSAQKYQGVQVNFLPGFLIAHREYMANMEAHTFGVEVNYSSNYIGWKQADEGYKHLRWGTGLTYFNMGNKELNGHVLAWHIHVEANLKKREKFQAALKFGSGIGYLDRPYNLISNKKNKAIGSKLNGNMQVMYKAYFDLSQKTSLVLGAGVTHYSNGNFKRPNLGVNMMHLDFGLLRKIKFVDESRSKKLPELFPSSGFEIMAAYARKQIAVADTRFFNIYSSSLLYYFKHNKNSNWRMGAEAFLDKTYPYTLFNPASLKGLKAKDVTELALKVGHEFMFGRLAIVTDLGTYVYRPNDYKKRVYFAIGFNYCFGKGIIAQTRLKSHMAVADYFYWGGAYRFKLSHKVPSPNQNW